MLRVIRQIGHLSGKVIMLAQDIGGGREVVPITEGMVGMKLQNGFLQGTTTSASFAVKRLLRSITLFPIAFLLIILEVI